MEELINKYKMYINAYQGILTLDEYPLKPYILEELKDYIKEYKEVNKIPLSFQKVFNELENTSIRTKYQDALYVMNELNAPIDLIHLIESKIKSLK